MSLLACCKPYVVKLKYIYKFPLHLTRICYSFFFLSCSVSIGLMDLQKISTQVSLRDQGRNLLLLLHYLHVTQPCYLMIHLAINPFLNKPWFLRVCCASLLKTHREKEKLLVTSNFFFSFSVFYLSG